MTKIIVGCSVIILVISGTAYVIPRNRNVVDTSNLASKTDVLAVSSFVDEKSGVRGSIPTEAERLSITDADIKDGIFLRLQSSKSPEYFINMRIESGLRLPAQLAKLEVLDLVVDGALRSLPTRYPEFSLLSETDAEVAGKQAKVVEFNYKGPSEVSITQKIVLVPIDNDRALYISQQSKTKDFATLDKSTFSNIIATISLQ